MLTIREMRAEDASAVLPMVRDFYHSPAVEHEVDTAVLERTFRDAVDRAEPFLRGLLLLEGEKPVGYCYVTGYYAAEVGGRCLMIEELYFTPDCRGKGYGRRMLAYMEERLLEKRMTSKIYLVVTESNQAAQKLYAGVGYQKVGRLENLYRKGVHELLMEKFLSKMTKIGQLDAS